ncbi:MAG TPA: PIN domain-containing protein [Nitrospiria bacterium]|nr:PIN domain-containing protein [Nitrospiria bacterium]
MSAAWWIRGGFILLGALLGGLLFGPRVEGAAVSPHGLLVGAVFAALTVAIERAIARVAVATLVGAGIGAVVGIGGAGLLMLVAEPSGWTHPVVGGPGGYLWGWRLGMGLLFGYLGGAIGGRLGSDMALNTWRLPVHGAAANHGTAGPGPKLLDTSVIIDGRIADLCETGFIEGGFILPQFILQELQHIADSSDSLKRARGRRGLDVLRRVQEMPGVTVRIVDDDFPHIREVDAKLVALAKKLGAKIMTNDLNLNKVASLQGVKVLNINELSNALRPVVLPGESLRVFILKEGKEAGQGVAYLEDGTMVVVDDAKRLISKTVDVVVTSVLQTTAGRMIFTKLREEPQE